MADPTKTVLSNAQFQHLRDALDKPACPTPALVAAMRKHREIFDTMPHEDAAQNSDGEDTAHLTRKDL